MTPTNRINQLGQLTELKRKLMTLAVTIDSSVRTLLLHFDPLDADFKYIENIRPQHIEILVGNIRKWKKEWDQLSAEKRRLQDELGEDNGA